MSGTSLDGIDGAFLLTNGQEIVEEGGTAFFPYPPPLRNKIRACLTNPSPPLKREVEQEITYHHGVLANQMIQKSGINPDLIGFHGQTLFHNPPLTQQIGDGDLLAKLTGIPVVYDFRTNDCMNGGEGAPLVPIYHQSLANPYAKPLGIINIGGVSNITFITEDLLIAFDTGPGNALIDDYVWQIYGIPFDKGGEIAASGIPDSSLVKAWLHDPFFKKPYPKSLDRDFFKKTMGDVLLLPPQDAVATLTLFTSSALVSACHLLPQNPHRLMISGGGAKNHSLIGFLKEKLPNISVVIAESLGWKSDFIEAQAFAFLAVRHVYNLPLSFPLTTGVKAPLTGGRMSKNYAYEGEKID